MSAQTAPPASVSVFGRKQFVQWTIGVILTVATSVAAWFLTAPNVYSIGKIYPPPQPTAQSFEPGKFVVRAGTSTRLRNLSIRQASIKAEIIPVAAAIFPESESRAIQRIERIPEAYELSRSVVDVSPSALPPLGTREVRIDALFNLKLIGKRVVYIYKLRWIVENQGEVDSACVRFPLWASGMSPVSDKDSYTIKCD